MTNIQNLMNSEAYFLGEHLDLNKEVYSKIKPINSDEEFFLYFVRRNEQTPWFAVNEYKKTMINSITKIGSNHLPFKKELNKTLENFKINIQCINSGYKYFTNTLDLILDNFYDEESIEAKYDLLNNEKRDQINKLVYENKELGKILTIIPWITWKEAKDILTYYNKSIKTLGIIDFSVESTLNKSIPQRLLTTIVRGVVDYYSQKLDKMFPNNKDRMDNLRAIKVIPHIREQTLPKNIKIIEQKKQYKENNNYYKLFLN